MIRNINQYECIKKYFDNKFGFLVFMSREYSDLCLRNIQSGITKFWIGTPTRESLRTALPLRVKCQNQKTWPLWTKNTKYFYLVSFKWTSSYFPTYQSSKFLLFLFRGQFWLHQGCRNLNRQQCHPSAVFTGLDLFTIHLCWWHLHEKKNKNISNLDKWELKHLFY